MLENIKILLGITTDEKDALLNILISQVEDEVREYTNRDDICELQTTIEKMVVFNYNRLGTEGLNSESYSGNSYSYMSDYPESILRSLKRKRKIKTL